MSWEATFSIYNNTTYNITVTHNATGDLTTIPAGGDWATTTAEINNTNALKFWQTPNVWYMQGSCSFGPEAGVYVDRGWMAPNDQTITLTAIANGKQFIQTENGGETLLAWNEFTNGGDIQLTFKEI
jgi:hypothetical protein